MEHGAISQEDNVLKTILASCLIAGGVFASGPLFAQRAPLTPLPREQLQTMANVFGMINADSVRETDPAALIIAAVRGMVREADPEAGEYYDAKEFADFRSGRSNEPSTSGLHLEQREGRVLLRPLPGGAAMDAGVQFGDVLHAVNGARTATLERHQIAALLAGPQGSTYTVTVFRESSLSVLTLSVERRLPVPVQPSVTTVAPGVALLRVPHYQSETLEDTALALKEAWQRAPFRRGLIVDLRGSPGGLLTVSVGLASIFLPENVPVVSTHGRTPESNVQYKSSPSSYLRSGRSDPLTGLPAEFRSLPVAVLVDGATSAGAEIIAASLKDHRRATLLGQKTWGRGSIQTVRPLSPSDGLKITTSYWFSPSGARIHGNGVTPDVVIANPNSDEAVQQAVAALGKSR